MFDFNCMGSTELFGTGNHTVVNDLVTLTVTFILKITNSILCYHGGIRVSQTHVLLNINFIHSATNSDIIENLTIYAKLLNYAMVSYTFLYYGKRPNDVD